MNKKIKVLITTAVVLFLGLGIYTFASPNDEEDLFTETSKQNIQKVENVPTKKEEKVVEEQEVIDDEQEEQVLNVPAQNRQVQAGRVQQRQDNVQNQNKEEEVTVEVQDEAQDAYDAAEELVAKVEKSLLEADLTAARNAVNNVVDIDVTQLTTRLDKVATDIGTKTLVANLEKLVKDAKSKDDITTANTYNLTEEVETKVEAINNTELKEELSSTMTELLKVLNDTTKPLINIVDNLNTNQDVTINVTDDTKVIIKLGEKEIENGTKVTDEGTYTLTVIDEAFNEDTITFTIDKTAPTVDIADGRYFKSSLAAVITDDNFDKATLNGVEYKTQKIGVTAEGEYTLVMYDKAGNTSTIKFVVDKTAPTVDVVDGKYYNSNLTAVITDANFDKATLNGVEYTTNKIGVEAEGEYTLVMYDKSGNKSTITFYVDKTAPNINVRNTSVGSNNIYSVIDLQFSDNTKIVKTVTNGKTVTRTPDKSMAQLFKTYGSLYVEGNNIVELYDAAGNKTTLEFTLDLTAPEITVKEGSIGTDPIYKVINLKLHDNIGFVKAVINGTQEWEPTPNTWGDLDFASWINYQEGENTIELYDFAGNKTTYTFTLDTTPAKITKSLVYAAANGAKTTDRGYANKGNIHVRFAVDSALLENPIVKVGDKEVNTTLVGENYYDATFTIASLADGKFEFTITNVKDLAGNVTNDVTTTTNNSWIIVDKTLPTIEGIDTNLTNQDVTLTITDTNLANVTVNGAEVTLEENKITFNEDNDYVVVATDLAGNTTTKTFTIDKTFAGVAIANLQTSNKVADKIYYAKEKDRIFISVQFKEEINDNKVAFKLVQGQKELVLTDLTKKAEASGVTYSKYYNAEKGVFDDGEIKLLVTGIEDLAGNTANDITATTNSRRVFLDMTAPTVTDVKLTKNARYDKRTNIDLTFSEKIIKFNDEELNDNKITIANKANGTYEYTFTDISGNVGTYELTVAYKNLDPVFTVNTAGDLVTIKDQINSGSTRFANSTIQLNEDINLSKNLWNPIFAAKATMDNVVIDGNSHTITNLVTLRTTPEKMNGTVEKQWGNGFIGDIAQFTKVTIKNITFDGATITDPSGTGNDGTISQHYAGVVVGHNQGNLTLENITVTNATIKNSWQAGGLVGYSDQDLTFKDCTIKDSYIGGIQATTGTLFGLGPINVTVDNCNDENVQLYTDGLTWASTQLEEGKYYVGHLYGKLLVDNQSTEKDLTIVVTENEANDLQKVLNNALDGMTVYLKNGTYNVDNLEIKHNIKLIGESKKNVKINISKDLSGQAAMLVSNSAELKNFTVEFTGTPGNISVIKCTIIPADGMTPIQMIDKVVMDNIKVIGGKHGINMHAVKSAVLNKISTENNNALGVSISASNVTITNSNIPKGGWNASIGIMWKDSDPSYPVKSIVTIGEGNTIPVGYVDNNLTELDEKGNYYVLPDSTHTNAFSN